MGGGDIVLVAASLCSGWQMNIVAVFIGSLLGSVYGGSDDYGESGQEVADPIRPWLAAGIAISGMIGQLRF